MLYTLYRETRTDKPRTDTHRHHALTVERLSEAIHRPLTPQRVTLLTVTTGRTCGRVCESCDALHHVERHVADALGVVGPLLRRPRHHHVGVANRLHLKTKPIPLLHSTSLITSTSLYFTHYLYFTST